MAWNNQGGPWGGGQSPWGRGGGGGGNQPPDFEEMIKRGQDRMKSILPGGFGSGRAITLIVAAAVVLWLITGFYVVNPGQVGVNILFGRFVSQTPPGLRWNWPVPIGDHYTPDVATRNRVEVGFRAETASGSDRDVPEESLMLTGNENIIDVRAVVLWRINNVEQYLFGIGDPEASVKNTVEAALREIIGQSTFEYAITEGRGSIEVKARDLAQQMLDSYRMGGGAGGAITIEQLSLQKVDAPSEVIDSFRDVQKARADKEAAINDAQAYFNQVTEEAIGQSTQIVKQAEAYKAEKVAIAQGDAQRFISIYNQYKQSPDITERRLYLETMSGILAGMNKVIIDESGAGGTVPYLPLDQLLKQRQGAGTTAPSTGNTGATQ
ncbi:FtsH protease activity modulator HflK [Dongia rigui]|uniref:Protein HflK n=1 Tax=Dongia rigui TaxID=940149 RepID=A0ABU5DVC2_9PROT|nr:FtsH protease activity modulator HflK [Dongia rigui]MDY0870648.1 FtsH protease activity modulator HflK [Dongia rigui]